ncbi:MAG: outer membrane protein transport protein [Acidobacteriota bacterium]|nr:outer membrane protein transport protein [Acidobacteriota bacterium]
MRKICFFLAISAAFTLQLAAQNTDIESLSGLQFNFGNPGARSLGMGGAFLGLADDASAAEANPAGLTVLRRPEVSLEVRNYQEKQLFTTSGTFPDLKRTAFAHYSQRVDPTFFSFVYPIKSWTFGLYFHEPLRNEGSGQVVPERNTFTGAIKTNVPNFYLPKNGQAPVSKADCEAMRRSTGDFFSCLEYTILPFLSALSVQERTFGVAGAYKIGKFSVGGTVRYHRFNEAAFTFRVTPTFDFSSISVQATSDVTDQNSKVKDKTDWTMAGGVKWEPNDKFSVGAVYKQGAKFIAPTFAANSDTKFEFVKVSNTSFHVPDIYGVGVSWSPIPVLKVNADAVHITYSNLVDNFVSINEDIRAIDKAYKANDVTELHLGAEYFFFLSKLPVAVRGGVWKDPSHAIEYRGPLNVPDAVAAAILYPKGTDQTHVSIGAGLAWPKFQVDAAYDRSPRYRVGSISVIRRF